MSHKIKRADVPKLVAALASREDRGIGAMMEKLLLEALTARHAAVERRTRVHAR